MVIIFIKLLDKFLDRLRLFKKFRLNLSIKLHHYYFKRIAYLSSQFNNNLHPKHMITKYYQFFVQNISENSTVLDIGCGNGFLTYKVAEKVKFVDAIDINKNNLTIAKNNYSRENILYIYGDIMNYQIQKHYDYVILSNILEHIKNRKDLLLKIKAISGNLLIRVPMIDRSWLPLYKRSLGLDYRLDPTHYIEYTYKTFKEEMDSVGLNIFYYSIQFGEIWAKLKKV